VSELIVEALQRLIALYFQFVECSLFDALEGAGHMLRSIKDLQDYAIGATDGTIGHVKDFYFDDEAWVIRYLVVDTGTWLSSRKVLISPVAIGHPNWLEKILPAPPKCARRERRASCAQSDVAGVINAR
jgi:hypothetical protein